MYKLKKYNQYIIKEDVDTPTADVVDSEIDDLMNKLLEMTNKIKEETTKTIDEYFRKNTKDGVEITVGEQYYTYGEYNVSGYAKDDKSKKMVFIIKIDELVENGYKFSIIESMSDDTLKNIENNQVDILDDKGRPSKIKDKNIIDGRYLVSSQYKIDLIKPSDDEPKDKVVDDKVVDDKVVDDKVDVDEGKTIKKEINKLREKIDDIDDTEKLSSILTRVSQLVKNVEEEISKLEKLPKTEKVNKFKKILEVDLKLMKDLQLLITKKIKI